MQQGPVFWKACRLYIWALCGLGLLSVLFISQQKGVAVSLFKQDMFVLGGLTALLLVLNNVSLKNLAFVKFFWKNPGLSFLGLAAVLVAALLWAHSHFPVYGFDLSRDEVMASFDGKIIAMGKLAAAVPAQWRDFADALNPDFVFSYPGHAAWHSEYLPVNSALMALSELALDPRLAQPLLAALSLFLLFIIARHLFNGRTDAIAVTMIVILCSPQFLLTGLTTYAMTAHLAFNLIWLWFFLRDDKLGHTGAIVTGFIASGIHQFVFHPLFAAPFLLLLLLRKRWALLAFYAAAYAAIVFFWMNFWALASGLQGLAAPYATGDYWLARVEDLIRLHSDADFPYMLANLVRLITWQHILLIPLAMLGAFAAGRRYGIAGALTLGAGLTLHVMFVLLPYQGYGWGYRYLHGFLGSIALLAGYGWIAATRDMRQQAQAALVLTTLITALVLLPLRAMQAGETVAPYRNAYDVITHARTDFVIVDSIDIFYGRDLVRNDPELVNKPLLFDSINLQVDQVDELCKRGSVALFDNEAASNLGLHKTTTITDRYRQHRDALRQRLLAQCGKPIIF